MTPFATVADYEARYGEAEDEARVSALLHAALDCAGFLHVRARRDVVGRAGDGHVRRGPSLDDGR